MWGQTSDNKTEWKNIRYMINVHRYISCTKVEGPGKRFALWVQGCNKECKGCFASDTWSHEDRLLFSVKDLAELINNTSAIEGVTILGGEPFEQAKEISELIHLLRDGLTVIVFTGYKLEELTKSNDKDVLDIITHTDVLVDGEYIEERRELCRPMVGSSNQKFYFMTNRYTLNDFMNNSIEARVNKNGSVLINGNGRIENIII